MQGISRRVFIGSMATLAAMYGTGQSGFADAPFKSVHGFASQAFSGPPSPELIRFLADMGTTASLRASVRGLEELRDRDLSSDMGSIHIPTLICHGRQDKVVPFAAAEFQAKAIAGATLVPFRSSGHCVMYGEPDKLADEVARFGSS